MEVFDAVTDVRRHQRLIEQIEKGLMWIERGNNEMPRADDFALHRFNADGAAVLHDDAPWFRHQAELAAVFADGRLECTRQRDGTAARYLRLGRAREQSRDVMAKAAYPQIDLAKPVKEQESRPHCRMLEFLLHKFERRKCAHFEQAPARGAAFEQALSLNRRQRRRLGFRRQNVLDDRDKFVMPPSQRLGVLVD